MRNNFQKTATHLFLPWIPCNDAGTLGEKFVCTSLREENQSHEGLPRLGQLPLTEHQCFFPFLGIKCLLRLNAFWDWAELLCFSSALWFLFLARIGFSVFFFSTQHSKLSDMDCWLFDSAGFAYKPLICQGNSGSGGTKRAQAYYLGTTQFLNLRWTTGLGPSVGWMYILNRYGEYVGNATGREIGSLLGRSNKVRVMHQLRQLLALPPEEGHA